MVKPKTKKTAYSAVFMFGGEGEIRTLRQNDKTTCFIAFFAMRVIFCVIF
jgi:hypothetical protein